MKYTLAQNRWYGDQPVDIALPVDWDIEEFVSPGDQFPVRPFEDIREKFKTAVGTKPIRELAKGHEQVVIVFDDLTRATPTQPIAEVLLEELLAAGVEKQNIRFICGGGMHGPLMRNDMVRKLGETIVREYAVFNHNPYEGCVDVGVTPMGVKVSMNGEFMACDLKIGIGGLVPHPLNGFGGGGKIIMPGVASVETIYGTHSGARAKTMQPGRNPMAGNGKLDDPAFRSEVEAVVRLCHFDFKIDAILNSNAEMYDLFMGDPIEEYYAAAKRADGMYAVHPRGKKQVMIANANAKASEAPIGFYMAMQTLEPGGDLILVDHTPGQCVHFSEGHFGAHAGSAIYNGVRPHSDMINRAIIYSPYPDYTSSLWFGTPGTVIWAETWEEVMNIISDRGPGTTVGIFRDATIQHVVM